MLIWEFQECQCDMCDQKAMPNAFTTKLVAYCINLPGPVMVHFP